MNYTDDELTRRKSEKLSRYGAAAAGLGMAGAMQAGMTPIRADYISEGDDHFQCEWARILRKHGAIKWSGDPKRPYIWLWEVKFLAGLKIYTQHSWDEWAGFFYAKNGKPQNVNLRTHSVNHADWTKPQTMKDDDFDEGRLIDLPGILAELRTYFL